MRHTEQTKYLGSNYCELIVTGLLLVSNCFFEDFTVIFVKCIASAVTRTDRNFTTENNVLFKAVQFVNFTTRGCSDEYPCRILEACGTKEAVG